MLNLVAQLPDDINARISAGDDPDGDETVEGSEAWRARQLLVAAAQQLKHRHVEALRGRRGSGKTDSIRVTKSIRTSAQSFLRE